MYRTLVLFAVALVFAATATAENNDLASTQLGPLSLGTSGLDAGYRAMYNLQFDQAHAIFLEWEKDHPADPMGFASDAAAHLFSEFDRLHVLELEFFTNDKAFQHRKQLTPDPARKQAFLTALQKSQDLTSRALSADPRDRNALFANVMIFALRGDYEALVEHHDMAGLSDLEQARAAGEKLLKVDPSQYDAYVALGVENYLLSLHAAPIRWMLHLGGAQTDKSTGLRDLRVAASKGHLLQAYARLLLAVAAVRENERPKARELLSQLASAFPSNHLYTHELSLIQ